MSPTIGNLERAHQNQQQTYLKQLLVEPSYFYYFIFFHFGRTAVPSWQTKDVFSPVPYIVEEGPLHHKDQLPTGWGAVVFLTQGFEAQTVVEARLLPGPPWLHYEVS